MQIVFFSLESQSTLKFNNKYRLIEKAFFFNFLILKQIIKLSMNGYTGSNYATLYFVMLNIDEAVVSY